MFWALSALLVTAALAFIVVPLVRTPRVRAEVTRDAINVSVYRDQLRELDADLASGTITTESHREALREIERSLLADVAADHAAAPAPSRGGRRAAVVAVAAVPLLAAALYVYVGTPQALVPHAPAQRFDAQQIEAMVERLAERMKAEPDDAQGWAMLARSYAVMERFPEAASAYAEATKRTPNDAQLLADYADALAMAQGQRLEGEPEKLLARALAIDPDNVKALALAGTRAFESHDYAQAALHWERIARQVPADSPLAQSVRTSIDKARALAAGRTQEAAEAGKAPVERKNAK